MAALVHKERTVQDMLDDMTPEQRETMDLIVGAAVEDEVIDDPQVVADYDALSTELKFLIDFVVGNVLAQQEGGELSQDNLRVTSFLAHFGVKGMKWGVRNTDRAGGGGGSASKSQRKPPAPLVGNGSAAKLSGSTMNTKENRAAARKQLRKGNASAETAHVAALKSTGHRVANAFLGDKTYWKGMAITAGVAGATIGAGILAPAIMPAGALAAVGNATVFAASGGTFGASGATAAAYGVTGISAATTGAAYVGASVASSVLGITNLVRAVRGNSRIDVSYERLGSTLVANQKAGMKRTAKILSKDGGTSRRKTRKALSQSDDLRVGEFLSHHASVDLGTMKSGV